MKKTWILTAVLAIGATAAFLVPSTTEGRKSKLRVGSQPVPNRYIVVLNPTALRSEDASPESSAQRLAAEFGSSVDKVFSHALEGFTAEMTAETAEAMSGDPNVLFVEQDSYISVNATQNNAPWGLDRVDQRNVPLNTAYNYVKTGAGVNVYVVDTGIRTTHSEFGGRASNVYDSMYDGQNGNDCHGHGTHVAATIGGANYGVAKNVRLYGVRVLGCNGIGTVATAVEGIDWITANKVSPAVVNMSMGTTASALLDYVVQSAISSGANFVVAAGNGNSDACQVSPARVPTAITVGASDQVDVKAPFSNFGSCVDLFAPGVGITSAWNWNDSASFVASGTSMASPHVAGAVALYLQDNPYATPAQVSSALLGEATNGQMSPMSDGSPNLMLFTAPGSPTAAPATVSGTLVTNEGRAIGNIRVHLRGADGSVRLALTNSRGRFNFGNVEVGQYYVLTIDTRRFVFPNVPYGFTLAEDLNAAAFVGTPRY